MVEFCAIHRRSLGSKVLTDKWNRKPVDLLVGTQIHHGIGSEQKGFAVDNAKYALFDGKKIIEEKTMTKTELSQRLISEYEKFKSHHQALRV